MRDLESRVQPKCKICQLKRSVYIWQPFGPDESALCFCRPGYHYRGFPALHVCEDCRKDIVTGKRVNIARWNGETWIYEQGKLTKR